MSEAIELTALIGAALLAVLAALFFVVWRALRVSCAPWLGAAFLLLAAHYLNAMAGARGSAAESATLSAMFGGIAYLLITRALVAHVDMPRRGQLIVAAVFALSMIAASAWSLLVGRLGLVRLLLLQGLFVSIWGGICVWAMVREPRSGHGINALALLLFAVLTGLRAAGVMPESFGRTFGVVPHAVLGITLLVTSLLRAQRAAQRQSAAREAAQNQLRALSDSLEQRVDERTRALREHVDALESFNRSVSHDLRGPLGGIAGLAAIAREHLAAGRTAEATRLLDAMGVQAEHSMNLVQALLELARARVAAAADGDGFDRNAGARSDRHARHLHAAARGHRREPDTARHRGRRAPAAAGVREPDRQRGQVRRQRSRAAGRDRRR